MAEKIDEDLDMIEQTENSLVEGDGGVVVVSSEVEPTYTEVLMSSEIACETCGQGKGKQNLKLIYDALLIHFSYFKCIPPSFMFPLVPHNI